MPSDPEPPQLPVDPAGPSLPRSLAPVDLRVAWLGLLSCLLALATGLVADILLRLIALVTNLAFHQRFSFSLLSPAGSHLGAWLPLVPAAGGLVVGLMARYGSQAIRGHGIPEAMEQVLLNESRIAPRVIFLKPLSSAVSIGTGGPFGAEGPIIATGGALGSWLGQRIPMSSLERKTLLAAGAAAGMAATFGSPVSAVLLSVELLLFEFRPRSLIPVGLAAVVATSVHFALSGTAPIFAMPKVQEPGGLALAVYVAIGALAGLASAGVTKIVYAVEDLFERLPIHWMWWPALGGLAVGLVGLLEPQVLGVGYDNITAALSSPYATTGMALLCLAKFAAWSISLGSVTSGGTLAPLFTIGSALGCLLGGAAALLLPHAGIDPRIAALVGMAALFGGAARSLLAAAIFAFETTLQPMGLLPLLGGCAAAYLISALVMRHSLMSEKLVRRGVRVPSEYTADHLDRLLVRDHASRQVIALDADEPCGRVRRWIESGASGTTHQGFPVITADRRVVGVLTRRDLMEPGPPDATPLRQLVKRAPAVAFEGHSLREAADHMVLERVGRLPVVTEDMRLVGIITRSDLLEAHASRLDMKPEQGSGPASGEAGGDA